jgi:hypothetical protein
MEQNSVCVAPWFDLPTEAVPDLLSCGHRQRVAGATHGAFRAEFGLAISNCGICDCLHHRQVPIDTRAEVGALAVDAEDVCRLGIMDTS